MKKERFFYAFVLILVIGICSQIGRYSTIESLKINQNYVFLPENILGLIDHAPILIDSNDDFETLGFTGNGTSLDPYIIANLYINSSGSTNGIEIHNTNVHFEIINCTILTDYVGIRLSATAASTATINNNTCISKLGDGGGIGLSSTYGVTVISNECANFMQGIHLNHAHNNLIYSNTILVSNYQGINIRYSNYNEITYNDIENSQQHGLVFVGDAHTNVIHHNRFINNSKVETYTIDGERSGAIMSQGYDEGQGNTWYDEESKTGNRWSDYNGSGDYAIDGRAGSVDIYPLKLSYNESVSISILVVVFSLISVYSFLRRKRKK
ncbi:MAG: hypothetical protein FK732_09590 [Asgard group archaeon]|nr:hypothetical protein [Asgard group archaeon]